MPRRNGSEVVVILWRDIPAQVNAQIGRERHQVLLPDKFQRAIDRAKRKAKIRTAHEDVAQWRRISRPLDGDGPAAAQGRGRPHRPGVQHRAARQARLRRRVGTGCGGTTVVTVIAFPGHAGRCWPFARWRSLTRIFAGALT